MFFELVLSNLIVYYLLWQVLDVFIDKDDSEKIRESIIYAVRPEWKSQDILEKVCVNLSYVFT